MHKPEEDRRNEQRVYQGARHGGHHRERQRSEHLPLNLAKRKDRQKDDGHNRYGKHDRPPHLLGGSKQSVLPLELIAIRSSSGGRL